MLPVLRFQPHTAQPAAHPSHISISFSIIPIISSSRTIPAAITFSFYKSKNIRTNPAKIPPKPPQTFPPLKKFSAACKNCGILSLLLMGNIKALPSPFSANEPAKQRWASGEPVSRRWVQTNPSSLLFSQGGEAVITRTIHAISKTSSRPVRRARKLHTTKAVQQTDCACNPGRHKKTRTTKSAE